MSTEIAELMHILVFVLQKVRKYRNMITNKLQIKQIGL